jgi:hypothetical protein
MAASSCSTESSASISQSIGGTLRMPSSSVTRMPPGRFAASRSRA